MMTRLRLFIAALRDFNLRKPLRHPLALIRARATNGEAHAQYQLGEAYLAGWSVPRQPATGAQWLQRAADQGHVRAQHSLSLLYMSGGKAIGDAASWLRETAASGNAILFYPDGLDVVPDHGKAVALAQAAAEQGLACAQANLGMLYLRGIGCEQDFSQAEYWCRRAAAQNESAGALGLGFMHEHGFGIERDPTEAARWYAKAAELGNDAAATALGLLHLDGLGVDRDLIKARRLMAGPASRGDSLAKKGMAELYAIAESETQNTTEPDQRATTESLAAGARRANIGGHQSHFNA